MAREGVQCPRCGASFGVEHTARAAVCPACAAELQVVRRAGVAVAEGAETAPARWPEPPAPHAGRLPSPCYRQMGALDIAHLLLAGGVGVGAAALLRLTQGHFGPLGPWADFLMYWAAPAGALAVGLILLWQAWALRQERLRHLRTHSYGGRH